MCEYVCTCVYCAKAVKDAVGHLALKGFPAGAWSVSPSSVAFHAVVPYAMHYLGSHHSPHQDLQSSDPPSFHLLRGTADSAQRVPGLGAGQRLCLQLWEGTRQSLCNLTCPSSPPCLGQE